jgi:hypothetical protein
MEEWKGHKIAAPLPFRDGALSEFQFCCISFKMVLRLIAPCPPTTLEGLQQW